MKQPKYIQKPQHHNNDHYCVQDGLDGSLHWNETVYQPKQNTHYDQGYDNLNERHGLSPFLYLLRDTPSLAHRVRNVMKRFNATKGWTTYPEAERVTCRSLSSALMRAVENEAEAD